MSSPHGPLAPVAPPARSLLETMTRNMAVFGYTRRAVTLVWLTNHRLTIFLALLTIAAGLLPAAVAWVGKLIVDGVVDQMASVRGGAAADYWAVLRLVLLEGGIIGLLLASQRGINACQSLLRAQLGQRVNEMILEKALTLDLSQFEDAEFYDKLQRARREASSRPLSLVMRSFALFQQLVSLISFAVLIAQFSIWAMVLLIVAGLPAFVAETKFSGDAFRLFRFRAPEVAVTELPRNGHGARRPRAGSKTVRPRPAAARTLPGHLPQDLRRGPRADIAAGEVGAVPDPRSARVALYGAYTWIVIAAINLSITIGAMTMYLALFRQGQGAVSAGLGSIGGMYEDNLYLTQPVRIPRAGAGARPRRGTRRTGSGRRCALRPRQLSLPGRARTDAGRYQPAHPARREPRARRRKWRW